MFPGALTQGTLFWSRITSIPFFEALPRSLNHCSRIPAGKVTECYLIRKFQDSTRDTRFE